MFVGRRAVVTGASSGIGRALCQRLSQMGYNVTMVARNEKQLRDSLTRLSRSNGQQHDFGIVDLEELCTSKSLQEKFKLHLNGASLLVNCAGVTNHNVLTRLSIEAIHKTINLNLVAPIILSKLAVSSFLKEGKKIGVIPSILNLSSLLSISGVTVPGTAPYAASKAGLLGFTESLAAEMKGRIRVNAVLPALVPETAMGKSASKDLPVVSLKQVINVCQQAITDENMNGKFLVADGPQCRTIELK